MTVGTDNDIRRLAVAMGISICDITDAHSYVAADEDVGAPGHWAWKNDSIETSN
jgi:hypothetical protein